MSRPVLPPGTLLQHMYLRERLRTRPPGTFVEVGVGSGHLSRLLLDLGWRGIGYDLSAEALARSGASSMVSTNTTPCLMKRSTTWRLWTIS